MKIPRHSALLTILGLLLLAALTGLPWVAAQPAAAPAVRAAR
jgi:hypothetical protein